MKRNIYYCEECQLAYKDSEKASECEEWCKKYKSCNLEITKHSINKKEAENNENNTKD